MCANRQTKSTHSRAVDRLKAVNEACNEFSKVQERWQDVMALQGHTLSESYVGSGVAVVCNLEVLVPLEGFGCCVRRNDEPIGDRKLIASLIFRSHSSNPRELSVSNQEAVFISDVEIMQGKDMLPIPSTVGLYDIHDESLDIFAGALFQSIDGSFHTLSGFTDREFSGLGIACDHLEPSVIQGRTKIVESISHNQEKSIRQLLSRNDAESIVSGVRIAFDVDDVRVCVSEFLTKSLKVTDVMFGPFNL